MAVAYVDDGAVAFCNANNNNAITVSYPAARPVGSVFLLVAFCRLITAAAPTITGYTLLNTFTSGTANGGRIWVYGRICDGTEGASVSVTPVGVTGNSGDLFGASIYCYSGVDTSGGITAIFDGTPTVQDASGTTTCTYPALTISNADSMILRFLARWQDLAVTFTPTATWNEREDVSSTVRLGGQHHWQDKLATASGAQASVTVTPSSTTATRYLAVTAALKGIPPPKQTATAEISLASANEPATRTAHSIKVRARKTNAAHSAVLRVRLYEGATPRSAEISSSALTTGFAEYTFAITDVEAAAISSYSNLSVRLYGYSANGTATVFEVSQLWLEMPASAAPPFPTVSVVDNFTRADQIPPGGGWLGSVGGRLGVVSNALKNATNNTDLIYWNAPAAVDNEIFVTLAAMPTASYALDLHVRRDHAANTSYLVRFSPATGSQYVALYKRVTGTDTQIGSTFFPTFAAGDSVGVSIIGSTIYAWHKPAAGSWTLLGSATDSAITAAGRVGIGFDNTAWTIDDFGGPVIPVPTTPISLSATLTLAPVQVNKIQGRALPATPAITPVLAKALRTAKTIPATPTLTPVISKAVTGKKSVDAALPLTVAHIREPSRLLAGTLALTAAQTFIQKKGRSLDAVLTLTPVISTRATHYRTVSASIVLTPALAKEYFGARALSAGLTMTPAFNRKLGISLTAGLPLTSLLVRQATFERTLAAGLTVTPSLQFQKLIMTTQRLLAASLSLTPTMVRELYLAPAASLTLTPALIDKPGRILTAGLPLSSALLREMYEDFSAGLTLTPAMTVAAGVNKILPASLVLGLTLNKEPSRALPAGLIISPALNRKLGRSFSASLPLTGNFQREMYELFPAGLTMTPAISRLATHYRALTSSLVLTPALVRVAAARRALAVGLVISPALNRKLGRAFTASLPLSLSLIREIQRPAFGVVGLTLTPTMTPLARHWMTMAVGISLNPDISVKSAGKWGLSASLNLNPVFVKEPTRFISTGLVLTPALVRRMSYRRSISTSLPLTAALIEAERYRRTLSAVLSLSPALALKSTHLRAINASLALTAALSRSPTRRLTAGLPLSAALALVKRLRTPILLAAELQLISEMEISTAEEIILASDLHLLAELLRILPPQTFPPPDEILGGLSKPVIISANGGDDAQIISVGAESQYVGK